MTSLPGDWSRVKHLFEHARTFAPRERAAFLDQACAGDPDLRRDVESLLASPDHANQFLETLASQWSGGHQTGGILEGRRLGPYQVSARVGAGGMGEVYKARDTRLDRTVAIKVLPIDVPTNPHARERFEREARAVAALNHPHICTLYDVGNQDGIDFLVMEFVDGETLAVRLQKGPLSVAHALEFGTQIASALERAHRAGIVHRDLKPGNVMLTKGGVKLLDFGLAKQRGPAAVNLESNGATALTGPGVILGTAQYMAPEQLEGRDADARTDLFAFGSVLYEMLTGKKAFEAPSDARLVAAIISAPPPSVTALRPDAPATIEYVIGRCLAKDPDDRWQTARDLRAELERIRDGAVAGDVRHGTTPTLRARSRGARRWITVGAALAAMAAATMVLARIPRSNGAAAAVWLSILPPPDGFDLAPDPAVSPDGRYIAYKAQNASHQTSIWLKALDSPDAKPIPGTEGTDFTGAHFWSPDSRSLGFFAGGKLKRVDIARSSAPQVLASATEPRGGTWSPSGVILFNADAQHLLRVSASGGPAERVTDPAAGGGVRMFPHVLTDGRHYLFTSRDVGGQGLGVYLGSLDTPDVLRISDAWSPAVVANDQLLFVREGALFAQPFDARRFTVRGEPQQIAAGVGLGVGTPLSFAFSASQTGTVTYWAGMSNAHAELVWFDRSGKRVATITEPADQIGFSMASDGRRIAFDRGSAAGMDVWLLDASSRGGVSRLTTTGSFSFPILSADGKRVVMIERGRGLVNRSLADASTETILSRPSIWPSDLSRDGRSLAYYETTPVGCRLFTISTDPNSTPRLYREEPFALDSLMFSPDSRWVAYMSDESGRHEVYVDTFPAPGQRIRVSTNGGIFPKWRPDGKELYYMALDRKLMAAAVETTASGLTMSSPQALFEGPAMNPDRSRTQFAPSADGTRFLFNALVEDHAPVGLTVVVNWPALLKK